MTKHLQEVLNSEIPLTNYNGIKIGKHTDLSLTLHALLINNINHKSTAFGGSIYSVSVLSGRGLIYLLLKQHNLSGYIVIQESNLKYIKPVTSDITAKCSFTSTEQQDRFIKMYKRKGAHCGRHLGSDQLRILHAVAH
jgi:thioesterase domain-containing protein